MSEDRPAKFTRRKLLGSVALIGAAGIGAGAGTAAYFQDDESVDGNSVQTGTLDLRLTDSNSIRWEVIDAAPGGVANETQDVILHNDGSLQADHVELDFSNTTVEDDDGDASTGDSAGPESDTEQSNNGDMARHVRVRNMSYDPNDSKSGDKIYLVDSNSQPVSHTDRPDVVDTNENGYIDMQDLAASENEDALDNFTAPPPDDAAQGVLQINVSLDGTTPNTFQGDRLETTLTATVHQDSSQNN